MALPSPTRAMSPSSDASSSIQSCIAVKPRRHSSPPSELHGASSTPPTSVTETPSIASDPLRSSPKRGATAMEDGDSNPKKSTRPRLSKQGEASAARSAAASARSSKAAAKRGGAETGSVKKDSKNTSKNTIKGAKYFSLQSWLSQSQRADPAAESQVDTATTDGRATQPKGLKRKRNGDDATTGASAVSNGRESMPPHAPAADADEHEAEEPSRKRRKNTATTSTRADSKKSLAEVAATKVGALAAQAKKVVSSARRSAREVAAKVTSTKLPGVEPEGSAPASARAPRARRAARDANAAPSNEEKAATALQHDSMKMQNKSMLSKGKFSTGPADEVMPLPNNWFIGKFGGTNDTYLKDFRTARGFKLGAEIFNPQPGSFVREGKDWAVTKGAKNVFAGNARAMWAKSDLANLPQSFCTCKPADACGVDCLNRIMEYECNDNNCAIGADLCKNRPFADLMKRLEKAEAVNNRQKEQERVKSEEEKRRPKYASVAMSFDQGVEVFEAAGKGYGVRAQRSFEPDQIIMEYFGEIIDQDEVEKRMATTYKDSTDFYMMQFHDGFILDATKGSMCRFVNHACEPNCEIRKMLVSTGTGKKRSVEPRMALFAGKKGIQFNEELTYDYNFDPFSTRNVQKCLCGSANCRGILGPRTPKERAQVGGNGATGKAKPPTKAKAEIAKVTAVAKTKTGVLATSSILKAAKRPRF